MRLAPPLFQLFGGGGAPSWRGLVNSSRVMLMDEPFRGLKPSMRQLRRTAALIWATWVLVGAAHAQRADATGEPLATPIIAQLYAEPEVYAGRPISVYGVVIETMAEGRVFLLQDVSFHPLKIVGNAVVRAAPGDQVTVFGTLRRDAEGLYLAANLLIPTRVTAGGGCC